MTTHPPPHVGVTIAEDETLIPKCPHCDVELTTIRARKLPATGSPVTRFGKRYVYACPACSKVLGITHRKGFWMG